MTLARAGNRLGTAFGLLAAWTAVTLLLGKLGHPEAGALTDLVTGGVGWNFVAASLLLILAVAGLCWEDLGLRAPLRGSLRLLWLPGLYIAAMAAVLLAVGLPPPMIVAMVGINAALVGFSEELMFRGFVYAGARSRLAFWPAVWLTSGLFGGVHVLNAVTTGAPGLAALQAVAAFMSGVHFLALRLRCRSVWPGVVVHALWDWVTLLLVVSAERPEAPGGGVSVEEALAADISPALLLAPLLLVLPLFAYGLFLMRRGVEIEA